MNEASPEKPRRRAIGRTAAATAAVLGATLLAYPGGTATAQTVDCTALGDNPRSSGISAALDAAIACDVEVRVTARAWNQLTVYATPAGELHLVATAEAVQEYLDFGPSDPTLELYEGTLSQRTSQWWAFLRYDDPAVPLFDTLAGTLDWAGDIPVPTFGETTAVYDELAPGLDLIADVGSSSVGFRFAAADLEGWNALATGLRTDADRVEAVDGSLRIDDTDSKPDTEWTTPFTVRDAEGATYRADLALDEDGALSVNLPEGKLAEAAFPLTLSTQWASRSYQSNEWGAVTSAAPDSTLYRGDAGLDEPYFVAAGQSADAVSGAYCDALAGAECTEAQAAAYWNFEWPMLGGLNPDSRYAFDYPVASAVFSVGTAEGEDCTAPGLNLTEEYSTATTWNDRPAVVRSANAGACDSGTAVYDLTEAVGSVWGDPAAAESITLGTADGAETARFDGGSARLDVYFDIIGFRYYAPDSMRCGAYESGTVFHQSEIPYGEFTAEFWRGLEDLDEYSWSAEFVDTDTGAVAYTTESRLLSTVKQGAFWLVAGEVPDGGYGVVYTISSDSNGFEYRSAPCHIAVDTSNPEIIDYTVAPGQNYVGEPVSIEVTVADEGFPDGVNTLKVGCGAGNSEPARDEVFLTDSATGTCEITPPTSDPWLSFWSWDRAGNFGSLDTPGLRATHSRNDFNGDGHQDLMAVRESDGNLVYYAGKGDGTFNAGVSKGAGWGGLDAAMAGDLNGDDKADLLARDSKTGYLYLYPGNGTGGLNARVKVGSGWNAMGALTSAGDFDNDGKSDILAVRKSDGALYLYPGNGNGTFGTAAWVRSQITSAWNRFDAITASGDVNGDGYDDFLVHDARTGTHYLYVNNGHGQFHSRLTVSAALDGTGSDRFRQVAGVGDVDGDNYEDLLAVDSRTGELELHSLADNGAGLRAGKIVGTSWGGIRLPTADTDPTYDYSGDGKTDVLVRRGSDGKLYFYSGNGTGGFGPISSWGTDLKNLNLIETAGDLNGDGFSDLVGRVGSTGSLYLFPGKGNGTYDYAARKQIGTGWNSMSAIVSGHDYNGDGKIDVIAREKSTGYLWLYLGKGDGTIGSRVKTGTGWNALRDITAAGDLDHDGHADIVAIRGSDNCMYFYGGRGDGTLKAGVKTSCNWVGYDSLAAVGDFNGDGHTDWIARRTSDGAVYLYKGNGAGGHSSRTQIASGWTWANAIA